MEPTKNYDLGTMEQNLKNMKSTSSALINTANALHESIEQLRLEFDATYAGYEQHLTPEVKNLLHGFGNLVGKLDIRSHENRLIVLDRMKQSVSQLHPSLHHTTPAKQLDDLTYFEENSIKVRLLLIEDLTKALETCKNMDAVLSNEVNKLSETIYDRFDTIPQSHNFDIDHER